MSVATKAESDVTMRHSPLKQNGSSKVASYCRSQYTLLHIKCSFRSYLIHKLVIKVVRNNFKTHSLFYDDFATYGLPILFPGIPT